jgi:hypothetical protein
MIGELDEHRLRVADERAGVPAWRDDEAILAWLASPWTLRPAILRFAVQTGARARRQEPSRRRSRPAMDAATSA